MFERQFYGRNGAFKRINTIVGNIFELWVDMYA